MTLCRLGPEIGDFVAFFLFSARFFFISARNVVLRAQVFLASTSYKMCDITYLRPTSNAQPCTVLVAALDKQTN